MFPRDPHQSGTVQSKVDATYYSETRGSIMDSDAPMNTCDAEKDEDKANNDSKKREGFHIYNL